MPKPVSPLRAIPTLFAVLTLLTTVMVGQKPARAAQYSQATPPTATATQPFTRTYVLEPELFARALSVAEQETLWAQGLPVPVFSHEAEVAWPPAQQSQATPLVQPLGPTAPDFVNGWDENYYRTDFETDFLNSGGNCAWQRVLQSGQRQWNRATARQQSGAFSLWPAADPAPAGSQYANDMHTDLICQLSNMQAQENVLASFKMWYKLADPATPSRCSSPPTAPATEVCNGVG